MCVSYFFGKARTGFIWLRIQTTSGLLLIR
jgi:hypothetical protein